MNRLLLILLLTIFSNGAMAEWKLFKMDHDLDIYVDIASKRKSGKKVKIWALHDYKSPQTNSYERLYLSTVVQHEYDCFNETSTLISLTQYTENMQGGSVVNTYTRQPAQTTNDSILPNSINERLFKTACSKK